MTFLEYPDRELLMLSVADRLAQDLGAALRQDGRASFSVPGGTTPGPIFDTLSGVDLGWDKISVFLNDERWVSEDSPRSNTRLLRERLLRGKALHANLVPLYQEADQPETVLDTLAEGLKPHLPISVLLLGMGADMHTASLFPGADRLADGLAADAPILLPMRAEAAGEPRITLTAPALGGAIHRHLLITGAEKRAALEQAQGLDPTVAPIRAFLGDITVHWAE